MSVASRDRADDPGVDPGLVDLAKLIKRWVDIELRVHAPARVVSFDPATCKATVRVELLPVNDVLGEDVPDIPLVLQLVPVRYQRATSGGTTIPLLPGDTGHVSFSDRALAAWLQNGNPVAPVDPESGRCHDLGDAFFEPGLMTDADAIANGPVDMTATVVDGLALVKVGANATHPTIYADAFIPIFNTFLIDLIASAAPALAEVVAAATAAQTALGLVPHVSTKALVE